MDNTTNTPAVTLKLEDFTGEGTALEFVTGHTSLEEFTQLMHKVNDAMSSARKQLPDFDLRQLMVAVASTLSGMVDCGSKERNDAMASIMVLAWHECMVEMKGMMAA